jgi:CRP/FNR family transcriptional regulator
MAAHDAEKLARSSCLTCRAFTSTEFEALPESDGRVLDEAKVTRVYEPGEAVFREGAFGPGIYCVGAGAVSTRKTDASGASVPFRLKYPGDTLGLRAFIFGGGYPSTAEALETSRVCFLDGDTIRQLLSRNINLALAFVRRLGEDLSLAEERLLHRGVLNARVRLARLLVNFVEFHGIVSKDDVLVFKLPFTSKEMAAILGVTLRTVSNHLRTLQRDGIVEVDGRNVQVRDFSRLVGEAELRSS